MLKLACALSVFASSIIFAQRSDPPVSLTETATRLAQDGATRGDARTVMAAAEILRIVERGSTRVRRIDSEAGPTGSWDGPMTRAALLRLASRLASDQGDFGTAGYVAWLTQLPDSVPPTRGATGGPVWADAYLATGKVVAYSIDFTGGQTPNALRVSGAKTGTQFECVLTEGDGTGPVAVRARSVAGACAMEWRQAKAGLMTLRIRNLGSSMYLVVASN